MHGTNNDFIKLRHSYVMEKYHSILVTAWKLKNFFCENCSLHNRIPIQSNELNIASMMGVVDILFLQIKNIFHKKTGRRESVLHIRMQGMKLCKCKLV